MCSESPQNLKALMTTGLKIQWEIENSGKPQQELQDRIQQGILILEDATRLVSILDIFSPNEIKEEIQTDHLPYLLLPALLGNLNIRRVSDNRVGVLKVSRIYYEDFLQRLNDYEIIDFVAPKIDENIDDNPPGPSGPPNIPAMNADREEKIRKYKQKKDTRGGYSPVAFLGFFRLHQR
ncbi:IGBP1 [Lepeophtheirus salmonis]|uniref:IGBP1 n=1 Tax=Lepeophtheirus salmonis TaxID=72036 RepID=A0A7R8CW43_LEPSM|nr:IGBP1 [Lepeophtheirus salmonis]CAF2949083.1 IGBP1 [Lepeophtheirus salmonis]